jgi:predicted amidohydrolase
VNAPDALQVSVSQQQWAKPPDRLLKVTLDHIAAAADEGSDAILFPEANLTGYDFAQVIQLEPAQSRPRWRRCGKRRGRAGSM